MKSKKNNKKIYLRRWLEKTLITINCFIFCFICCIDDYKSIKDYLLLLLVCGLVFGFNSLIIKKWGRLLKDDTE